MKAEICFISLSTEASFPVLSRVVMAYVAMERLSSLMSFSMSKLHAETGIGWVCASFAKVRMAANLRLALGEVKKS